MYLPQFAMRRQDDDISHLLNQVHHCDAMALLRRLPDASIDLIATDPPYFKVKNLAWDHQWDKPTTFIEWLKLILAEYQRVLKPNGSLYIFASPQMSARVEIAVSEYFNVLNHIVWMKPSSRHNQADVSATRGFFPQTERCIFAEHGNSDQYADDIVGYTEADRALKVKLWGAEILKAMLETNTNTHDLVEAVGAYRVHNNGGAATNWTAGYNIPTKEQYQSMYNHFNKGLDQPRYLIRDYEELRQEYEELRRPFNATRNRPYTDVWQFKVVSAYAGKHPTEKPLDMMKHIIQTSSREDAIVLDTFCGSGTTLDAARQLGRQFIGCDMQAKWVNRANARIATPFERSLFDIA